MKVKFNKFERVAGLFVLSVVAGSILTGISVAVKQGWFEPKIRYTSEFSNADGVHPGTLVQIQGLKAGSVEDVELQTNHMIKVHFYVMGKYAHLLRNDSIAQFIRPFIIGERVLEITVGAEDQAQLKEGAHLASIENMDIFNLLSGKNLNKQLEKVSDMAENVSELVSAFLSKDRTSTMVRLFDRMDPLMGNLDTMSKEVTRLTRGINQTEALPEVLANLTGVTHELNVMLPDINRANPHLGETLASLTSNLVVVTKDLRVLGPALEKVGPELPRTAERFIEALNETVVMLKAMQRNFFLRSSVEDIRQEEAKREREKGSDSDRKPATSDDEEP